MDAAARLLASAWGASARAWWRATGLLLALVLVLAVGSAGLMQGMQDEAKGRVAQFYTGDLRLTAERHGAAPSEALGFASAADLDGALGNLTVGTDATAFARAEATALLSRRSLAEAVLFEDEQFGVALPGVASDRDAYLVGVLVGVGPEEAAAGPGRHLVIGRLPLPGDGSAIEVLLSTRQVRMLLDETERERMPGLPTAEDLAGLRVEVTAAHLDASGRDLLRLPGRVTGLYDSGLDALDQVTVVAPIEDVRRLLGEEAGGGFANAITVHGDTAAARSEAARQGWTTEGSASFTHRYAGEILAALRFAGLVGATGLAAVPAAMLWLGLAQQMERTRRELAVCRAIGVGPGTVRGALARLAAVVVLLGLGTAAVLLAVVAFSAPAWSVAVQAPVPVAFTLPWGTTGVVVALAVAAAVAAVAAAARGVQGMDVAALLRSL